MASGIIPDLCYKRFVWVKFTCYRHWTLLPLLTLVQERKMSLFCMEFGDKKIFPSTAHPPPHLPLVPPTGVLRFWNLWGKKGSNLEANVGSHFTCFSSFICMCRELWKNPVQSHAVLIFGGISITAIRMRGYGGALAWAPFWVGGYLGILQGALRKAQGKEAIFPNSFQQV